jgi:hypothetical protein
VRVSGGVALVVALGLASACGGDGDSSESSDTTTTTAPSEVSEELELGDDDVGAIPIELEAGDALRVAVSGYDTAIHVALAEDDVTPGFKRLVAHDQDDWEHHILRQLLLIGTEVLDDETFSDLEDAYYDEDLDAGELEAAITDVAPDLEGNAVFLGTDHGTEDLEGVQLVAPVSGTYTVVVLSRYTLSEVEVDVELEVEDGEALDDDVAYDDYIARYGEHVDFFCDEDFFGGAPEDVTNYGPTVCDPDELEGVLSDGYSGDFTNDFGGG